MSTCKILAVSVLLCSTLSVDAQLANGGVLPTDQEIQGIKNLCGGGDAQVLQASGNLDAAIKNWKNAAAGAEVSVAKKNLAGAIAQVKNDANLAAVHKVYVDCVNDTLQKFLDREAKKPRPVSRSGQTTLLRSSFVSDQEMKDAGCEGAEEVARERLRTDCGSRTVAVVRTTCSSTSGSPRTFTVLVDGECRSN